MKSVSFAICVSDEIIEIKNLLYFLLENKRKEDEIIVLLDVDSKEKENYYLVEEYIKNIKDNSLKYFYHSLKKDFGLHKNYLSSLCKKDYIINLDADEIIDKDTLENYYYVIENNDVDLIMVPRVNIVKGIKEEHIERYNWKINEKGYINFPDYQMRIYRNNKKIVWIRKVHEILYGFDTFQFLPESEEFCIFHIKNIEKQIEQNEYYMKI